MSRPRQIPERFALRPGVRLALWAALAALAPAGMTPLAAWAQVSAPPVAPPGATPPVGVPTVPPGTPPAGFPNMAPGAPSNVSPNAPPAPANPRFQPPTATVPGGPPAAAGVPGAAPRTVARPAGRADRKSVV